MTLTEIRAAIAASATERAELEAAAEARFADAESTVEVRGAFVVDDDGNPTAERDQLAGFTEDEAARWVELDAEDALLQTRLERGERVEQAANRGDEVPPPQPFNVNRNNDPFDYDRARNLRGEELRGQARAALGEIRGVADHVREDIERTMDTVRDPIVDRYIITNGNDRYRNEIFPRFLLGERPDAEPEARAMAEVRTALSLGAGYTLPIDIDPTMTQTAAAARNPWRRLATVRSGTTEVHHVNSIGMATSAMAAEGAEVTDGTPSVGTATITAERMHGAALWSFESEQDVAGLMADLNESIAISIADTQATQFRAGTGSTPQTFGILRGSDVTRVSTDVTAVLDEGDLLDAYNQVPQQYLMNTSWVMSQTTANHLRTLESSGGTRLFRTIADAGLTGARPESLLGRPLEIDTGMDGPAAVSTFTQGDDVVVVGDVAACFRIYDRIGTLARTFLMTGTTANLPTGQNGIYWFTRFGSKAVLPAACRVIDIV